MVKLITNWQKENKEKTKQIEEEKRGRKEVVQTTRNELTEAMYQDKMTPQEFADRVIKSLPHFVANMIHLKRMPRKKYMEDWMGTLSAWMECDND